jgi:hypothetical protein
MREAVEWIESLPYSTTQMEISGISAGCMYIALVCGILMMRGERVRWWWLIGVIIGYGLSVIGYRL